MDIMTPKRVLSQMVKGGDIDPHDPRFQETLRRSDFTLDHAPDWVFEVMSTGIPTVGGVSADMDVPGLYRPAENVLMVYGCITARREAIGGVPVRISDPEGNMVESGPLFDLFQRPNQTDSYDQYIRKMETYKTLYNMCVAAMVGEPGALPDELVPLSPAYLTPIMGVHTPTGTPIVMNYRYADPITGRIVMYTPEELLIHRGFNPHAPLGPLAPLTTLRRTMQEEIAARELNLALLQNNGQPAGILENDQYMHKEQAEEVLNFWNQKLQGWKNRGKVMATWGGLKYHEIGLSPQEMEYITTLKFLRTDYYIIFRVPPSMVYEFMPTEMGKGNETTNSQKVQWWEDVGVKELGLFASMHQPIVDRFFMAGKAGRGTRSASRSESLSRADFLRRAMVRTPSSGYTLWYDENSIPSLVEHRLGKLGQAKDIIALGWRPDDVNDYLDLRLPPHPDNVGRVSGVLQIIGPEADAAAEKKAEEDRLAAEALSNTNADAEKGMKQGRQADPTVKPEDQPAVQRSSALARLARIEQLVRAESDGKRKRYETRRDGFQKFIAPREKAAARKYSRFFLEQKSRVLDRLDKMTSMSRAEADTAGAYLSTIFPKQVENSALYARLAPLWTEHLRDGWDFLKTEAGIPASDNPFAVDDPRVMAALKQREIQAARINDTTENVLRDLIGRSLEAGETTAEMGDRIAEYYAENCIGETSARPMTAARTQTAGIVNQGRQLAAEDAGGLEKFWIHGNPNEPREAHVAAAERYQADPIPVDEPFDVNGIKMMYPGDPDAPAAEVCNCTCMVGYRVRKVA